MRIVLRVFERGSNGGFSLNALFGFDAWQVVRLCARLVRIAQERRSGLRRASG